MALGDKTGSNNNNYENTYYSRVRFRNGNLSLGFSFWKGLLKVSITQAKDSYSGGTEYEEVAAIHLSPLKAKSLISVLQQFSKADYKDKNVYGIDTGISDTRNIIAFGVDSTSTKDSLKRYVVIGKVDPAGNLQSPARFDFNVDYNFSIEWSDFEKMECAKVYQNDLEIDTMLIVLDEFVKSITGAVAYSVMDMGRFDYSRINTKIELVMDALNIERQNKKGGDQSNSFFNKNGAASPQNSNRGRSQARSIDDLEQMME